MSAAITTFLREHGQNHGLFGALKEQAMRTRRTREAEEKGLGQTWRDHTTNAIMELVNSDDLADHDLAAKHLKLLRPKGLEEQEQEEEGHPDPSDPEDFEDQSQAGRGRPEKGYGVYNTAGAEKSIENMESLQRRRYPAHGSPRHLSPLMESRSRKTPRQLAAYAARLLRD
jgi:hypothetical protein